MNVLRSHLFALVVLFCASAHAALDPAVVAKLASADNDEKAAAIAALAAAGEPRALPILLALAAGELQQAGSRLVIVQGEATVDAITGEAIAQPAGPREEILVNNRIRREIETAVAAMGLLSDDVSRREAAAREFAAGADPALLPLLKKAQARETDAGVGESLARVVAAIELKAGSRAERLAAARLLGGSGNPTTRTVLLAARDAETDAVVKSAVSTSLRSVESRLARARFLGLAFSGVSLGSILLLAALGLAITYGLMGVINMAHGELIMIGAYTTFVVQNLFRAHWPGAFDAYLAFAVPAAFAVSALVGMALERTVIRWLYGRPLETLLATWGISLVLIQAMRTIFGAQNVQVENPAFMSGGIEILTGVVLPWSRIVIVAFAAAVLAGVGLVLARTRLGLYVRGVTQNRPMAACVGVPTSRVDTWAFGLGSGLAGLAGCALSQIGNVGPDLGQAYIVDSFMVVVLGGVGQLAGTVYAALGLGFANKLLESWSGAVLAKIVVLVFIIVFIQKRPQGLFAMKGRAVEA